MSVLVWDSKINQKIQETGHMDDTLFDISCLFKASGNWDEIIKALSSLYCFQRNCFAWLQRLYYKGLLCPLAI